MTARRWRRSRPKRSFRRPARSGNPSASTFIDTFRYLEPLGRLAKRGVQVVAHNTLAASDCALIDEETLEPRPNLPVGPALAQADGTGLLDAVTLSAWSRHIRALPAREGRRRSRDDHQHRSRQRPCNLHPGCVGAVYADRRHAKRRERSVERSISIYPSSGRLLIRR